MNQSNPELGPQHPDVSVLMPVLNPNPTYFREALQSVLAQTLTNFELLIVEEPAPNMAEQVLSEFPDPRIRHLVHDGRTNLAEQLNRGLQAARADLVARFDADDICEPDRLEKQAKFMKTHPEVGVLGTQLSIIDSNGKLLGYRSYPVGHDNIVKVLPRYNPFAHPSVMYRRKEVLDAGGYIYPMEVYAEDYELWCKLERRGAKLDNLPEVLVHYRIHPGAMKATKLRGFLKATVHVKRHYWQGRMDWRARLRVWCERCLLYLPPTLVLKLFTRMQFQKNPPTHSST